MDRRRDWLRCAAIAMARIRLVPQSKGFYPLLDRAAANLVAIAGLLVDVLEHYPDRAGLIDEIKDREHEGDRVTYDIVQLLNRTFVTPVDREDLYSLATAIDDIVDYVDEVADEMKLYGVQGVPADAVAQGDVIMRASLKIASAIAGLDGLKDIQSFLVDIHRLEDEGDRILRHAVVELFSNGSDPMMVIRWKDIHEDLERAVDACEHAAHVLESVYLKNR
jgi:predicted phosphate transport protein (TIGR00153 family)